MIIDWKNPEPYYKWVWEQRAQWLHRLRTTPGMLDHVKAYYRENPWQMVEDWGITIDPRNVDIGRNPIMPFVLFPKQREWMQFVFAKWRKRQPGLTEKSRDCGISWCAMGLSCALCMLFDGMQIGFGSRKEEYVDQPHPKALLYKGRMFMQYIPREFKGDWDLKKHAPHMRIEFPTTRSVIGGEVGDSIGRGDRTAIYFVDEAAHLEHPELADFALSSTTNCRQDMSSVAGMANSFAQRRHSGKIEVFTFNWREDPRKDQAWYDKFLAEHGEVVTAQEVDIDYNASAEGIVIPSAWVQAAVGAHIKLGIAPTGIRTTALDVADQGIDKNAQGHRHGILLEHAESWSGKASDLFATAERAVAYCDRFGLRELIYDGDGLGASVRGDVRKINDIRKEMRSGLPINTVVFRGSYSGEKLHDPERIVPQTQVKAKDFFANYKAQSWWSLRFRFENTWRAVNGKPYDPENLISIGEFPERARLLVELSQAQYLMSGTGKLLIDKTPDGVASPNLADMVMMLYAPRRMWLPLSSEAVG